MIQDSGSKIDNGTNLVNKSGDALNEIIESTKKVGKIISEIAAASEEQRQGIDQINTAVGELDTMTQQNAALVEETASASEEMANQAQDLLSLVDRFTLNDNSDNQYSKHVTPIIKNRDQRTSNIGKKNRKTDLMIKRQTANSKNAFTNDLSTNKTEPRSSNLHSTLSSEGFEEF